MARALLFVAAAVLVFQVVHPATTPSLSAIFQKVKNDAEIVKARVEAIGKFLAQNITAEAEKEYAKIQAAVKSEVETIKGKVQAGLAEAKANGEKAEQCLEKEGLEAFGQDLVEQGVACIKNEVESAKDLAVELGSLIKQLNATVVSTVQGAEKCKDGSFLLAPGCYVKVISNAVTSGGPEITQASSDVAKAVDLIKTFASNVRTCEQNLFQSVPTKITSIVSSVKTCLQSQ